MPTIRKKIMVGPTPVQIRRTRFLRAMEGLPTREKNVCLGAYGPSQTHAIRGMVYSLKDLRSDLRTGEALKYWSRCGETIYLSLCKRFGIKPAKLCDLSSRTRSYIRYLEKQGYRVTKKKERKRATA